MAQLISRLTDEFSESDWIETIWQLPVQRIFWIYAVPNENARGGHRHHSCHMVLHCVSGTVTVYVQTPTADQQFTLDSANQYLFVGPDDWRLMQQFSDDAMLVVFASKPFETTIYYEQPYRPIPVGDQPRITPDEPPQLRGIPPVGREPEQGQRREGVQ